jgi:hypothetical protein
MGGPGKVRRSTRPSVTRLRRRRFAAAGPASSPVLLAALAYGSGPQYATFRDSDQHLHAERPARWVTPRSGTALACAHHGGEHGPGRGWDLVDRRVGWT